VDELRVEAGVGAGVAGTGVVWFDVEVSASAGWASAFSSISVSCTRELSFTGEELWVTAAFALA